MATSDVKECPQDPILVAVMGQTGTGKSSFINKATGASLLVGHALSPCTKDIKEAEVTLDGRKIILIDSPGFDDATLTDIEILQIIGVHLQQGFKEKKFLTGIVYMRRITDNRVPGSALNNLRILRKLCGADHYAHIALVTSHWDLVAPAQGEARENELRTNNEYWGQMIRNGATVHQHSNCTESAIEILRQFLPKAPVEFDFQREFVAMNGNIGDTTVGKEIIQILGEKLGEYQEKISQLTEDNKKAKSEKAKMEKEMQDLRADIEQLRQDREREREEEREREREISRKLKAKEKLIKEAITAKEKVEGDIQKLKAAIDNLNQERQKENLLNEDLRLKLQLIDEARIAKEKAEKDVQDLKKEMEGVQQGEQTEGAIEEDLKSKEELVAEAKVAKDKAEGEKNKADGEMQSLITEIDNLRREMEKQKKINEDLKSQEQLLNAAETSKKKAEGEVRRLEKEKEKLQQSEEKEENAVKVELESKNKRISEIKREKDDKDLEIGEFTPEVEKVERDKAMATEAMESLTKPTKDEIYVPGPKSKWSRFAGCATQ